MRSFFILLTVFVIASQAFTLQMEKPLGMTEQVGLNTYLMWKKQHGKSFGTVQQEEKRLQNFYQNLKMVEVHNKKNLGWKMELNKFSDMSFEEFKSARLMEPQHCSATGNGTHVLSGKILPKYINWQEYGRVTPVKDQGECGSCWTFSTTGCLESATAIHKQGHPLYTLSEQQLVDCAQQFDNHGCNGGLPSQAFEYIQYNKGIMDEWEYKYEAKDDKCRFKSEAAVAFVNQVMNITSGDEDAIADAIAFQNPVSVAFQVTDDFVHYKSGVYSNPSCGDKPSQVNHAVLAVGFGETTAGKKYWIVKNSWNTHWGQDGYFFIERGVNACGISDCASYPIVV